MREPKPLPYTQLEGLSEKQLKEHHDVLYAGYVKKINEIEEKLKTAEKSAADATYSEFGELKLEETFATYSASHQVQEGTLVFTRSLTMHRTALPVEQYPAVRSFYQKILALEQSPAVLVRK